MDEAPNFTKVPNLLIEKLAKTRLSNYESRIILAIERKTYGFHKNADWISLSQFSEATGMAKPNVSSTLKKLRKKNIVIKEGKRLSINNEFEIWGLSNQITKDSQIGSKGLSNQITRVIQIDNKELSNQITTKERKKIKQKKIPFSEIINYLNNKADKNISPDDILIKVVIRARCNEGYVLDDFKDVIDHKVTEWKGNEIMDRHLNPVTLFKEKHFNKYLNQSREEKNLEDGIGREKAWELQKEKDKNYDKVENTFIAYQENESEKCAKSKNYMCSIYKSRTSKHERCRYCFNAGFWKDKKFDTQLRKD